MRNQFYKSLIKTVSLIGLFCIPFLLSPPVTLAQNNTVSGSVTDAETGKALVGVNILVVGTSTGTATDAEGHFSLNVSSLQDSLRFSYIGYQTTTVAINGRTTINIELKSMVVSGKQLVVVGFGTQKKRNVISGISNISTKQLGLEDQPVTTAANLLKGRVTGVMIRETSGSAGSVPQIRIRGISSINAGVRPLIVVNGFPVGTSFPRSLDASDIKSITVLKDAASTAIYGARGSNGVVLIETKSGHIGQSEFSYNGYVGVRQVPNSWRPDMLNALQYARYNIERRKALHKFNNEPPKPVPEVFQNVVKHPEKWSNGGTDWLSAFLREGTNALTQKHNISYRGGNKKFQGGVSLGFQKQDGIVPGNKFQRISLRGSFNMVLNKNIKMNVNLSGARINNNKVPSTNGLRGALWSAITTSPLQSPYDKNGNLRKFIPADSAGYFTKPNPIYLSKAVQNEHINRNLQVNIGFDFKIIEGLHYKPRFSHNNLHGSIIILNQLQWVGLL